MTGIRGLPKENARIPIMSVATSSVQILTCIFKNKPVGLHFLGRITMQQLETQIPWASGTLGTYWWGRGLRALAS